MSVPQPDPVLACNVQSIPLQMRPVHAANTQHLLASIQEVQELPTGYALRLPHETEVLQATMAFLISERLCCPFFHFTLDIPPEQGPIWLHVTGATDVKDFIQSTFGIFREHYFLETLLKPQRTTDQKEVHGECRKRDLPTLTMHFQILGIETSPEKYSKIHELMRNEHRKKKLA